MAGTAAERASDLMDAFEDESVDAILVSDSGIGSRELVPLLDPGPIAAHAKPFVGFCDTVFLHQFLSSHAGMSSYLGCIFMLHLGEGGGPFPETIDFFQRALMSSEPLSYRPVPTRTREIIPWIASDAEGRPRARNDPGGWNWIRAGQGRGQLLGGEISILPELIQDFGIQLAGKVLFWDVTFANTEPIRPQFEALLRSVEMSGLAGMMVGMHPRLGVAEWAAEVSALVRDLLPGASFPVVANSDLSHSEPSWIVPYGEEVVLDDVTGVIFPRAAQHSV
jgi:muramoyltetrapeptide carboxypeptidase